MTTNLNKHPYYDDFDESKNFHKILFNPGRPVQARELTQLQSILQNQIARHGNHVFRNGTMVIPGHILFDNQVVTLKVKSFFEGSNVDDVITNINGKAITGQTTGVKAKVVHVERANTPNETSDGAATTDPIYVFIRYVSSGETSGNVAYAKAETILCEENGIRFQLSDSPDFSGTGSLASISTGIYYVNGYFVQVYDQTVAVSKTSSEPTAKIGLIFQDSIITASEDDSLNDNALGFTNFAAPGADRYKITLTLGTKQVDLSDTPEPEETNAEVKFIDLLEVRFGEIQYIINETKYAEIERLLARRTFEESGDYIVSPFNLDISEYRSNNRGDWAANTVYLQGDITTSLSSGRTYYYYARNNGISGSTAPTHTFGSAFDGGVMWVQLSAPVYNKGLFQPQPTETLATQLDNEQKMAYTVGSGKAYIRGYEATSPAQSIVTSTKARDFKHVNSAQVFSGELSFFDVDTSLNGGQGFVRGTPDINIFEKLTIKDASGVAVGFCRVYNVEPLTGSSTAYRFYLLAVEMNTGKSFKFHSKTVEGSSNFKSYIKQSFTTAQGTVTVSGSTVSGIGTSFEDIPVGSRVFINGDDMIVTAVTSDISMTISGSAGNVTVPTNLQVQISSLIEGNGLVIPVARRFVKFVGGENGEPEMSIIVARRVAVTAGSTVITLTDGETLLPGAVHIYSQNAGAGDTVVPVLLAASGTTFTTTAASGELIYYVSKAGSAVKEKVKTYQTKTIYVFSNKITSDAAGAVPIVSTGQNISFGNKKIILTEADVIRVLKVSESSSPSTYVDSGSQDITNRYTLDNGQTPTMYGIGSINLKSQASLPSAPLMVTFEYFDHSSGDVITVNSYKNVPYSSIPASLRDSLDFRPRISDDGTGFSGLGSVVGNPLKSNVPIGFDYDYYLPRVDVIQVNSKGRVSIVSGKSDDQPKIPDIDTSALDLFTINLPPYTRSPNELIVIPIKHKRYTMGDIEKLENRIVNLEEYVVLSALERKTADMVITDEFGFDRFKNGFFTDPFTDTVRFDQTGESLSAIDVLKKECRPSFGEREINVNSPTNTESSRGYIIGGDRIKYAMLTPISHQVLVNQPRKTDAINVNPFDVTIYRGNVGVFPSVDTWIDTEAGATERVRTQSLTDQEKIALEKQRSDWGHWEQYDTDYFVNVYNPNFRELAWPFNLDSSNFA